LPIFYQTSQEAQTNRSIEFESAAEKIIYIPLLSKNVVTDEIWKKKIEALPESSANCAVPICLDDTGFKTEGGMKKLNAIRAFEYKSANKWLHLKIEVLHEIYRHGLNPWAAKLKKGSDSAVKLFLSHAKTDSSGLALAKLLKSKIDDGRMKHFFDATDIGIGNDFEDEITEHLKESTVIAICSDDYSSRYWCQREILAAKEYSCPIVGIDLFESGEDRRFPLSSNIPIIRINPDGVEDYTEESILKILKFALVETIRFHYATALLTRAQAANWIPSNAEISARPPEAAGLHYARKRANAGNQPLNFAYPEPTIYPEELQHLKELNCICFTPLSFNSKALSGHTIGLSISDPSIESLESIGHPKQYHQLLAQDIARHLLASAATLVYGGDFRPKGITEFLLTEAAALQNRLQSKDIHIRNHVAWPIHIKPSIDLIDLKAKHIETATIIPEGLPDDLKGIDARTYLAPDKEENRYIWSRSLSYMRDSMIRGCSARICAGGRSYDYKGWMPGVMEESLISIQQNKPLYLLGGFGGITKSLCEIAYQDIIPKELTLEWQMEHTPELEGTYNYAMSQGLDYKKAYEEALETLSNYTAVNGLSEEENKQLSQTPFIEEAIHLIIMGIKKRGRQ